MNVGDYVRTDKGLIARIKRLNSTGSITCDRDIYYGFNCVNNKKILCDLSTIKVCSPNIIDLIEVGDVITTNNLCGEVTKIDENKIYTTCYDGECCSAEDIKSIVTKEQFKRLEYIVGE